jgi:hypothetical protein
MGKERLQSLLNEPAIDHIIYRGNEPETCYIENSTGKALIRKNGHAYEYQPESGDPLLMGGTIKSQNHSEALAATFDSTYPDAFVQIIQLMKSRRAGDLVVNAKTGYDLRDFWEYPEHKGSHGSLHTEHMSVPLIYNQKEWASHAARTADLFPSILKWMSSPACISEGDALF